MHATRGGRKINPQNQSRSKTTEFLGSRFKNGLPRSSIAIRRERAFIQLAAKFKRH
jgi:hypothetical protein